MSSGSKSLRAPRHVNLRTTQRRLRHVRSLAVRSLKCPEAILWDHLGIRVKFTLHDLECLNDVMYTSRLLEETYNPTWRSLSFRYDTFGEQVSLSKFIIRVWLTIANTNEDIKCFEKLVDLSHYVFMGSNINRQDGLNYPANSVVIATSEGYYCSTDVGGYPSPHRPTTFHELTDYLPRNSLIEVHRNEVSDSYQLKDFHKMLEQQNRLTKMRKSLKECKEQIIIARHKQAETIRKREEYSRLKVHVELLRRQLTEQRQSNETENRKLTQLRETLDNREKSLHEDQNKLAKSQAQHHNDVMLFSQRRDQLAKTQRKLYLRQRTLVSELSQTFCIKQLGETFTICDVILPDSDPMESGASTAEQTGVALGFVAHLVYLLSQFLLIPLQYPIQPIGSKAIITDDIHLGLEIREFPLYSKGTDKPVYQFGLYLLWRDILQMRQHCGYTNSKSTVKRTLPNLKNLLDKLMMDKYSIFPLRETSTPSIKITNPALLSPSPQLNFSPYHTNNFLPSDERETPVGQSTTPISFESNGVMHRQEAWSPDQSPRSRSSPLVDYSKLPRLSPRSRRRTSSPQESTSPGSGSPSQRTTSYMLNVPYPLSDTDRILSNISVMESVPASLPMMAGTRVPSDTSQSSSGNVYSASEPRQAGFDFIMNRSQWNESRSGSQRNGSQSGSHRNGSQPGSSQNESRPDSVWSESQSGSSQNQSESMWNESQSGPQLQNESQSEPLQNESQSGFNRRTLTDTDLLCPTLGLDELSLVSEEIIAKIS